MPDTKDYISRLMNRNNNEIDDILSFAEDIRSRDDHRNYQPTHTSGNTKSAQEQAVIRTFHHIIPDPDQFRPKYSEFIIPDSRKENDDLSESSISAEDEPAQAETETEPVSEPKKTTVFDKIGDTPEDADEFMKTQASMHPKFYFALGISIFILAVLGFAACIHWGLNALRVFTEGLK